MTHRIDERVEGGRRIVELQGLLDRAALSEVRARCAPAVVQGTPVRVVLLAGTEVEPGCLEELAGLPGLEVVAEAAFLRRWLERRGAGRRGARRS